MGLIDLDAEAIRLTGQVAGRWRELEVRGLLDLMLLQHALMPARYDASSDC